MYRTWKDGSDFLDGLGRGLVQYHADEHRAEHHLETGLGDADGVDRHDRAEERLAQQGRGDDAQQGGHSRRQHGQRNVAARNVDAEIGGFAAVDGTDQDQAGQQLGGQVERLA